jgi:hypothetical protein
MNPVVENQKWHRTHTPALAHCRPVGSSRALVLWRLRHDIVRAPPQMKLPPPIVPVVPVMSSRRSVTSLNVLLQAVPAIAS